MAGEAEDDVLELDTPLEVDETEQEEQPEEQADDEVPTFGDEPVPEPETDLVRKLRREIRERDRKLAQQPRQQEQPIEVGPRPTLEAVDFDQDRFDAALDEWDAKREAKRQQDQRAEQQARQQNDAWAQVQSAYASKKAELRYADKDQREAVVFEALPPVSQAVIAKTATNPALFIYAVGGSQAKLDHLASIDDPLVLAATIGRMEATLQTKKRARPPEPEQVTRGGTVSLGSDKTLAKLEAEADRTGDRSKLIAYRNRSK